MRRHLLSILLAVSAVSALLSASAITEATTYIFTTIDAPFPGAFGTSSTGINDLGQITGFYITSGFAAHGYVLSDGNFSAFDFTGADCCTIPHAINNQGQVVGFGGTTSFLFNGSQFSIINVPGSVFTMANGINNAGQIVGTALVGNEFLGFFLDAGRFSFIRVPGAQGSDARGINDVGQIVGLANGVFLFSNGVFSNIDFPVAPTVPQGINNRGTIVGWYQAADLTIHGFVRDQQGFSTIDFPGSTLTAVLGINNRDELVGEYNDSLGFRHGFVAKPKAPAFAGTPGRPNCHGESVSTLARRFGGLAAAAAALGFSSEEALQDAVRAFCEG